MGLDEQLNQLPIIGSSIKQLFSYFKKHTALTDLMHVSVGLGIGLLIFSQFLTLGVLFLSIGVLWHVYSYFKGDKE